MFGNVCSNLVMLALKDLISTRLYSNLNVIINPQWNNLFFMHTTLSNQTNDEKILSFDNSDFKTKDHVACAPTDSMGDTCPLIPSQIH
jgi:hypothetical protein